MPWKPEHAQKRREKEATDPAYAERRRKQGEAKDAAARKAYMAAYVKSNPEKFRRTPDQQAKVNADRRKKYAEDKDYREQQKASVKAWQVANPAARKGQRIKKYGLTVEDYSRMMAAQRWKCAVCGHSNMALPKFFPVVDHCHSTGKVRGLLCMNCNMGLGKFKDQIELLEAAIRYLENRGRG